jgi:hypothetical protein
MNGFLHRRIVLRQDHLERSNDAKHNHLAQEVREDFLNALHGSHDSNAERHRHTIRIGPPHFIFLQQLRFFLRVSIQNGHGRLPTRKGMKVVRCSPQAKAKAEGYGAVDFLGKPPPTNRANPLCVDLLLATT